MTINETAPTKTMRNHWFEYVAKTRKKLSRGKKGGVSHREAMREASQTWPAFKKKLLNKINRTKKKLKSDGVVKL